MQDDSHDRRAVRACQQMASQLGLEIVREIPANEFRELALRARPGPDARLAAAPVGPALRDETILAHRRFVLQLEELFREEIERARASVPEAVQHDILRAVLRPATPVKGDPDTAWLEPARWQLPGELRTGRESELLQIFYAARCVRTQDAAFGSIDGEGPVNGTSPPDPA